METRRNEEQQFRLHKKYVWTSFQFDLKLFRNRIAINFPVADTNPLQPLLSTPFPMPKVVRLPKTNTVAPSYLPFDHEGVSTWVRDLNEHSARQSTWFLYTVSPAFIFSLNSCQTDHILHRLLMYNGSVLFLAQHSWLLRDGH